MQIGTGLIHKLTWGSVDDDFFFFDNFMFYACSLLFSGQRCKLCKFGDFYYFRTEPCSVSKHYQ